MRSRAEIVNEEPALAIVVELLCDMRDLLGECAVRLSDIEARMAEINRR